MPFALSAADAYLPPLYSPKQAALTWSACEGKTFLANEALKTPLPALPGAPQLCLCRDRVCNHSD